MTKNKLNILITAGPTREYIDPVRYLSNDSSGQMGFALAAAAKKLGHEVRLIAGPVSLGTPKGVKRIDVTTAIQMKDAVLKTFKKADVIIMSAAVADYRPKKFSKQKIKKDASSFAIPLVKNPDILAMLGKKKKPSQLLIGFALETENIIKNAKKKLKEKNCDLIIANHASAIGAKSSQLTVIYKDGTTRPGAKAKKQPPCSGTDGFPLMSKKALAGSLLRSITK